MEVVHQSVRIIRYQYNATLQRKISLTGSKNPSSKAEDQYFDQILMNPYLTIHRLPMWAIPARYGNHNINCARGRL